MVYSRICNKIDAVIKERGLTLSEIEEGSGVSRATISRITRGQSVQSENLNKLLAYLDLPAEADIPSSSPELLAVEASHKAHIRTLHWVIVSLSIAVVVLFIILLAVAIWFVWDVTHSDRGLIRLMNLVESEEVLQLIHKLVK